MAGTEDWMPLTNSRSGIYSMQAYRSRRDLSRRMHSVHNATPNTSKMGGLG